MIHSLDTQLDRRSPHVLGLFRIVIGFLFAMHGTMKLFGWPIPTSGGPIPVGSWPFWWAGIIELAVGLLVMVGLFTRLAALLGSGAMAFAYFTEHQSKGLWPIENGGEMAVLYCFSLFVIAFVGGGAFAVQGQRS